MGPTLDQRSANPFAEESAAVVGRRIKSIFGGSIGNLIEWYDFYVYNSFAIYFAKSFSSSADPTVQLITSFGIYAVGFFIRPVGGLLLGYYSDRAGRRAGLTLSVILMCLGSLMIAVLPTYAAVGIWAPVLLLLARLLQGLSLGGEYASSATYLSEVAGARHRGFYSSFQYVTLIGGQVLAALVLLVMQQGFDAAQLTAWAWRIPFAIGALGSLYGFYLRRNLVESEEWTQAAREPRRNLLRELFQHPRELLLVFGLTMGGTTAFYTFSSYMPTYLANTLKFPREWVAEISFISLLLFAAMQPLFGALSDRIGRRPVLMWFGVMGTLCTVPILSTLETTHGYLQALVLLLAAFLIVSGYTSINAVVKAELFPAGVRALGVGLPYALAASLFGGTAPLVALQFKDAGHESWFYWYVTGLTFLSLLVYALMRDTKKASRMMDLGGAAVAEAASDPAGFAADRPGTLSGQPPTGSPAGQPARSQPPLLFWAGLFCLAWGGPAASRPLGSPLLGDRTPDAANAADLVAAVPGAVGAYGIVGAPILAAMPQDAGAAPDESGVPVPNTPSVAASGVGALSQPPRRAAMRSGGVEPTPPGLHIDMVELPGGMIRMGSNEDPSEKPVHAVEVAPFLLAKHATTVAEWQRCVDAMSCPPLAQGGPEDPITNVSWDDARQFMAWLSRTTLQPYRLPTEAEWEYAARAGTETRYAWGNAVVPGKASCRGCGEPVSLQALPRADAHPPNAFGLFGMGGGVAEWVADCWHRNYVGAPADGSSPWDTPRDCPQRVLRGGSWMEDAYSIRPSGREFYDVSVRYLTHGFRIARSK